MTLKDLAEGLAILVQYASDGQYACQAEHDELWAGDDRWPLTDQERSRMVEMGWTAESGMGWHAFV